MTDGRYDILFEPVKIGPVTTTNRFYQVPHCNGMGHRHPRALAAMRGIKAEGGWGVVCTEEVEIHPSSDLSPYGEGRLWDDQDIPAHRLVTDAIHAHGSLAAIELVHNGHHAANLHSRIIPMAPSAIAPHTDDPMQARAMDLADIAAMRQWYRKAALRARAAGYDIIYVYAGHDMTVLMHFMLPRYNQRTDDYGGSLENRVRLTREILTETRDAVGDTCAVAFRFAVDELMSGSDLNRDSEGRDVVGMLAELPDLWDVNISDWSNDSATFRFEPSEGYQTPYTSFVKSMTTKPVVGVGRFTSPDEMVRQVRKGNLDLIGAARPSIADPFLPQKIKNNRIEDIRECIGCNICVSGDNTAVPMRCTQNPTMGEEWRRGWHPEKIAKATSLEEVLIVGAGPAGLEAAHQLALGGHQVTLAEAHDEVGGRCRTESTLPGLASYRRVSDFRHSQLVQMTNVDIHTGHKLTAGEIADFDIPHVVIATGATWRNDGIGRALHAPVAGLENLNVFTPDDIMAGRMPKGRVVVFDDDHYYMGGVVAEALVSAGCEVRLVTPGALVSSWTVNTLEQEKIQTRLMTLGVTVIPSHTLDRCSNGTAQLACTFTGRLRDVHADAVVLVTARQCEDTIIEELKSLRTWGDVATLTAIGDCFAPATVAAAVYAGHLFARNFGEPAELIEAQLYRRERVALAD